MVQRKAAPRFRFSEMMKFDDSNAIPSSVMILIYPAYGSLFVPAILRAEYNGLHSGQISFPGGRYEVEDITFERTALRETAEETGIDVSGIQILGSLTKLFIPRSNYIVYPFVGYLPFEPVFNHDQEEVQEIVKINLGDPHHTSIIRKKLHLTRVLTLKAPGYQIGNHFLWGASAMIFTEFLEVIRRSGL